MTSHTLHTHPIHLGLGAKAIAQPPFTGTEWYDDYAARSQSDGAEGRLVLMHSFSESWDSWEMHPHGDEVVICIAGSITLVQEHPDGSMIDIALSAGDYAINPPGIWHTANVAGAATTLFITAGMGTEHRPR